MLLLLLLLHFPITIRNTRCICGAFFVPMSVCVWLRARQCFRFLHVIFFIESSNWFTLCGGCASCFTFCHFFMFLLLLLFVDLFECLNLYALARWGSLWPPRPGCCELNYCFLAWSDVEVFLSFCCCRCCCIPWTFSRGSSPATAAGDLIYDPKDGSRSFTANAESANQRTDGAQLAGYIFANLAPFSQATGGSGNERGMTVLPSVKLYRQPRVWWAPLRKCHGKARVHWIL